MLPIALGTPDVGGYSNFEIGRSHTESRREHRMGSVTRFASAVGFAGALAALCAFPAEAGCKRMAFSVNDYGKDGPTKDSQELLDKHIATWAAEQGIEKYTTGKKDVTCELFLNLIVVDEHTCTARATVCWGGDKLPGTQEAK